MDNPYSAPNAEITEIADNVTYQPQIFALSGRIGRLRYIGYGSLIFLVWGVIIGVIGVIGALLFKSSATAGMLMTTLLVLSYIPLVVYMFVLAKRRLNDLDNTGWLALLLFIPLVGFLFSLYMWFAPGTNGRNRFGPMPAQNPPGMALVAIIPVLFIVVGILAAVAIPAYQQYVMRAKAAQLQQQSQSSQNSNP